MRVRTDLTPRQSAAVFQRFLGLVGWNEIRRTIQLVEHWRDMPVYYDMLKDERRIERAIFDVRNKQRATGNFPKRSDNPYFYYMLAFAAMVVQVHRNLSEHGKRNLLGKLRGALRNDGNLVPIRHEMAAAVQFMRAGWDVSFTDLEGLSRFDFLITSPSGLEVEVECKTASADSGRKVHRADFRKFCDKARTALTDTAKGINHARIGIWRIPDRFPTDERIQQRLAVEIGKAFAIGDGADLDLGEISFTNVEFDIDKFTYQDEVKEFIKNQIRYDNENIFLSASGKGATFLVVTSESRDQVLTYIYKQIKRGHEQFSGNNPGLIWINVADIEQHQWHGLKSGSGLQIMASRYLASPKRENVPVIAFSSFGDIVRTQGVVSETGNALYFKNDTSLYYNNEIVSIFRP